MNQSKSNESDLHRIYKHFIKFKCVPQIYSFILSWIWEKKIERPILEYIEINKNDILKNEADCEEWSKKKKDILKVGKDYSYVSFLHDLLPCVSNDSIARPDSPEYSERIEDEKSIEFHLNKVKNIEDKINYEDATPICDELLENLKTSIEEFLTAAGKRYEKNETDVQEATKKVNDQFDCFSNNYFEAKTRRIEYIRELLDTFCAGNLREISDDHTVHLPLENEEKVNITYDYDNVQIAMRGSDGNEYFPYYPKINLTSSDAIDAILNTPGLTVIDGSTGCGKTELLKCVQHDYLKLGNSHLEYKLPIYIDNRLATSRSIGRYLKDVFSEYLSIFSKKDILDALVEGNGVIFLVDEYYALSLKGRALINNIMKFVRSNKSNCSCIIALREFYSNPNVIMTNFHRKKIDFLRRYGSEIEGSNTDKLVTDFENLEETEQMLFNTPLLLKFFCSLSINGSLPQQKFKSEICIYEALIATFEEKIKNCLIEGKVDNYEAIAKEIIEILSNHCLEVFSKGKYYFDEEDFNGLLDHYFKKYPDSGDIESILKFFLFPSCLNKNNTENYYYFSDRSICEYLVMKAILQNDLNSSNEANVSSILLNTDSDACLGNKKFMIKRYAIIVKFLLKYTTRENITVPSIFWRDLKKYFIMPYKYWLDLLPSLECGKIEISEIRDNILGGKEPNWMITEGKHLQYLSMLLEVKQPTQRLVIKLKDPLNEEEEQDLLSVMSAIKKNYRKDLHIQLKDSYENFKPIKNDFFNELKDVECNLVEFKGCVNSEEHVSILCLKYSDECDEMSFLIIHSKHKLRMSFKFEDVAKLKIPEYSVPKFVYAVQYTDSVPDVAKYPLHVKFEHISYTSLCIVDIPVDGLENTFKMIKYLVPDDKRECSIYLGRCLLSESDVATLTLLLNAEGFNTHGAFEDENSGQIIKKGVCHFCECHTEEDLPCWRLFSAGCLEINGTEELSRVYDNLKTGGTVRSLKMVINEDLNEEEEDTMIKFLSLLESDCERVICLHFQYSYDHFKPISESIMKKLKDVRGTFNEFRGAISSQDSLTFLSTKACEQGMEKLELSVTLNTNLNLEVLTGISCHIHFKVQYSEDENEENFSLKLPTGSGDEYKYPSLSLDGIPANGKKQAFRMINSLAPAGSKIFRKLYLENCSLSQSDFNELRKELLTADIKIENGDETDDEECSFVEDQDDEFNIKNLNTLVVDSVTEIHNLLKTIDSMKNVSKVNISLDDELTTDDEDKLKQLLSKLNSNPPIKKLSLKLNYSHNYYKQIGGDVLMELLNFKSEIEMFKGAVSSHEVLNALKAKLEKQECCLQLSSCGQTNINYSSFLPAKRNLCCTIKYSDDVPEELQTDFQEKIVGDQGKTDLKITDIPIDGKENVLQIIKNVDPKTGRFRSLNLIRCSLSESDVKDLMLKLYSSGIKAGDGEQVEVKTILEGDEDFTPAHEIIIPNTFSGDSMDAIDSLVELLEYGSYFTKIEITLSKDLTGEDEEKLKTLFTLMKSGSNELELSLKLEYSYWNFKPISEDVLVELQDARCVLDCIQIAISSRKAIEVLKSKMNEKTNSIEWSVPTTHDLNLKNMYPPCLDISPGELRMKYSDSYTHHEEDPDLVESAKHWGKLLLTDVPTDGKKNAFTIIRDVSKNFRLFSKLTLENCSLSESDLNELLQELCDAGVSAGFQDRMTAKRIDPDDYETYECSDDEDEEDEISDYDSDAGDEGNEFELYIPDC